MWHDHSSCHSCQKYLRRKEEKKCYGDTFPIWLLLWCAVLLLSEQQPFHLCLFSTLFITDQPCNPQCGGGNWETGLSFSHQSAIHHEGKWQIRYWAHVTKVWEIACTSSLNFFETIDINTYGVWKVDEVMLILRIHKTLLVKQMPVD